MLKSKVDEQTVLAPEDFPEDIVIEVWQKLPVKSLERFKVVSNTCYNLFMDPNFIANHSRSNTKQDILVAKKNEAMYVISCEALDEIVKPVVPSTSPLLLSHILYGVSNGVLCLGYRDKKVNDGIVGWNHMDKKFNDGIALWNPAIRKIKILPSPSIIPTSSSFEVIFGLNVDLESNTYKAVKIILSKDNNGYLFSIEVEIYTKGHDSWNEASVIRPRVEDVVLSRFDFTLEKSFVALDGIIYWKANYNRKDNDFGICGIVSFDMHSEKFDVLTVPNFEDIYICYSWPVHYKIEVLNESLSIISTRAGNGLPQVDIVDIWIKEKRQGNNGTFWTKTVSIQLENIIPLHIVDCSQQLILAYKTMMEHGSIAMLKLDVEDKGDVVYSEKDIKKHTIGRINESKPWDFCSNAFFTYKETLFQVN